MSKGLCDLIDCLIAIAFLFVFMVAAWYFERPWLEAIGAVGFTVFWFGFTKWIWMRKP